MKRKSWLDRNKEVASHFLINGWIANIDYLKQFGNYYINAPKDDYNNIDLGLAHGKHYLISSDKNYAVSIKASVLTIHSAERNYCKVISMKLADLTCQEDYVREGNIIFKLGTV